MLLHCCHQLHIPVRAIHVHHGLQSVADGWVVHCQQVCAALSIELDVLHVDATKKPRLSPEESAREARYGTLFQALQDGECLLTGQHLDDQAETLLLQLLRAAGSAGLAAMPARKKSGDFWQLRPLLAFSRSEILACASENELRWVEDPSNRDERYSRNFIRQRLLPLLQERMPDAPRQLAKAAALQAENLEVLQDMAATDLAQLMISPEQLVEQITEQTSWQGRSPMQSNYRVLSVLSIDGLSQLSQARQFNVLRYWVKTMMQALLPEVTSSRTSPPRKLLHEIVTALLFAKNDAAPVICHAGFEFRRFQNGLYLLQPSLSPLQLAQLKELRLSLVPSQALELPLLKTRLQIIEVNGFGLQKKLLSGNLTVCFRQGGESFQPLGRHHPQRLKKLLQEAAIPPWERDSIPLLYHNEELVAVIGLWVAEQHAVAEGEIGWLPQYMSASEL